MDPSNTWTDLTTFGNDANLAATYSSSFGGYLDFSNGGFANFITNPAEQNLNLIPAASITMWVNFGIGPQFSFISGLRYSNDFEFYFLTLDETQITEARVVTPNGTYDINADYGAYYNNWTHVCFTVNGTVSTLYLNGVAVGNNANITGTWTAAFAPAFMIGRQSDGGNPATNLKMSTFRYHTRARTAAEVLAEFNAEQSRYLA